MSPSNCVTVLSANCQGLRDKKKGFDVLGDENKIEKSVSVSVSQINVTGVQYYNGEIYILWVEDGFVSQVRHMFGSGGDSRYVSVYDGINYKEERK